MTRRDVLHDNVNLLARAARIIRQQPSFQLSLTPGTAEGASEVIVSAASKVPPSKAGRRISRVDIYVNGRPGPSIDAVEGTVPPTPVPIGRGGKKRASVEAQASSRRLHSHSYQPVIGRTPRTGVPAGFGSSSLGD